jgi:hypothetical protein
MMKAFTNSAASHNLPNNHETVPKSTNYWSISEFQPPVVLKAIGPTDTLPKQII